MHMAKYRGSSLPVLVVLLPLLLQATVPSPSPGTIVPGVGVEGLLKLGIFSAEIKSLKDRYSLKDSPLPTFLRRDGGKQIIDYAQFGLRLVVNKEAIELIVVLAPTVTVGGRKIPLITTRGISVGSPEKRVLSLYGLPPTPTKVAGGEILYYSCIGFDVSADTHLVRAILVFAQQDRRPCAR